MDKPIYTLPIQVKHKHINGGLCKPAIELRKITTDPIIVKTIISAAFHERPIIILPIFTDKLRSINTLIKKGILYKEKDEYRFNF